MKKIANWFDQQHQHQKKYAPFFSALLGIRPWRYFIYRLRYFTINTGVTLLVHLVEFYLLIHFFQRSHYLSLILMRIIGFFFVSAWWGALEELRSRLRAMTDKNKIAEEIARWLFLSKILVSLVILLALPLLITSVSHFLKNEHSLFDFYLFAIIFQISAQFFVKTIHSGCYAIRRVYRPLYSIIGPEIISLISLLIGWPLVGVFSLPIAFLIGSMFSLGWSYWFSQRMYQILRFAKLPNISRIDFFHFIKTLPYLRLTQMTVSSTILFSEGALLLLLFIFGHHSQDKTFIFLYMVSTLIRASFDWCRLFYFDLKRYRYAWQKSLFEQFGKRAINFAFIISLACWIISYLLGTSFHLIHTAIGLPLLLFFLTRSVLAYFQLAAFCDNRYFDIMLNGLILVISIAAGQWFSVSLFDLISLLVFSNLLSLVLLKTIKLPQTIYRYSPTSPVSIFYESNIKNKRMKHYEATLSELINENALKRVISLLAEKLYPQTMLCRLDESRLLVSSTLPEQLLKTGLSQLGAGTIYKIEKFNLEDYINQDDSTIKSKQALIETFNIQFPNGAFIDTTENQSKNLENINLLETGSIYGKLKMFVESPLKKQKADPFFVSASFDENKIEVVFIVNKSDTNRLEHLNWQKQVLSNFLIKAL